MCTLSSLFQVDFLIEETHWNGQMPTLWLLISAHLGRNVGRSAIGGVVVLSHLSLPGSLNGSRIPGVHFNERSLKRFSKMNQEKCHLAEDHTFVLVERSTIFGWEARAFVAWATTDLWDLHRNVLSGLPCRDLHAAGRDAWQVRSFWRRFACREYMFCWDTPAWPHPQIWN